LRSLFYGNFHDRSFDVASRKIRALAVAVPVALLLVSSGCATRASVNRLRDNVATLQRDLSVLRQAYDAVARDAAMAKMESRALEGKVSEATAALSESRSELAALRARLEAAETELRTVKTAVAAPPPAPAAPAVTPPPPSPAPAPVAPPPTPRVTSIPAPRVTPPPPSAPPVPAPARPRETPSRLQTAEQTYGAALATFRAREHGQAVLDFLDFMAKYPGHPLVANAQYWIGEAYYSQRDYRQAMVEFQKVSALAPGSAKASDALLRIGMCQRNLRDEVSARQTWERVVRDFPQSEAAVKARGFLKTEAGSARH
jgi:tol-pal system protein YbgF